MTGGVLYILVTVCNAFEWYTVKYPTSDLIFLSIQRKIKSRVGYSRYTTRKLCITILSHATH